MSQCICSICSNRGPDIVYPILPKQLFPKYLQQTGVNNKSAFITSSFREYVHFRCAFFMSRLKWVKEVFNRSHLDYVCFGLEWILSMRNKEEMCAVCQKSYRAKVLLNCLGRANGPCNKRYHTDCVIAVRKRIFYKPGKVTLLCNEHFSEGKMDPDNRILDWMEFDRIVQQHIENNILSQEQEKQNYIASANLKQQEISQEPQSNKMIPQKQISKPFIIKQKISTPIKEKDQDDIQNQLHYLFRPRELFQIDYSSKNPLIMAQTPKRQKQNVNGFGRKTQTVESSSMESSLPQEQNQCNNNETYYGQANYCQKDFAQKQIEQKFQAKQAELYKNAIVIQEEHEIIMSAPIQPPVNKIDEMIVPERCEDKGPINMLEDNDEGNQIFSLYDTKKNTQLNNQFKKQMVQDPIREQLTKPQLKELERLRQIQEKSGRSSEYSIQKMNNSNTNNNQQNESQNKIKQLQQDLEEVHINTNPLQYLAGRHLKISQQQQQSSIQPKIRFKRFFANSTEEDEVNQVFSQQTTILPKSNYKIEVLSQLVPIYPYEEEEKRWESMTAWWSKIDEYYFEKKELQTDFREQMAVEITIQPTVELLKKTYLSVLFQEKYHHFIVHYELDFSNQEKEIEYFNGNSKHQIHDLVNLNILDRQMKQIQIINGVKEKCTLKYVEALQLNDQELNDSIKLHKSIVASQQNSELDIMYQHLMKEFEELSDANSASLNKLQMKINQSVNHHVDLLSIIPESISLIEQLRWREILRCFEIGFKNKTSSVLTSYNFTMSEGYQKIMHIYEQQIQNYIETDCQVCFSGQIMQLNPIIYCEQCSTSFHQYCYGIPEDDLLISNTFKCDKCKCQNKKNCYICKKRHSPLPLKLIKNNYFHPTCIVLFDYLSIHRPLQLAKGIMLSSIEQSIDSSIECRLCQKKKGRKIKCQECDNQYHILCAYLNGFEINIRSDIKKKQKISLEILCGVHTISLEKLIDQIFYRRFSINYDDAANYESSESYYEEKLKEDVEFKQVKKIFECESIELMPRKKQKIRSDLF